MLIFSESTSARFDYACSIVMRDCDDPWKITTNLDELESHTGPKIYYGNSRHQPSNALCIERHDQMWMNGVVQSFRPIINNDSDVMRPFQGGAGKGFDIFSACFYLITRYEEYQPFQGDVYGRFAASNSMLYGCRLHRKPLVDIWIKEFQQEIVAKWPQVKFNKPSYQFISTIDVDSAFAYKHKGLIRTAGGIAKDIASLQLSNLKRRLKTLTGFASDEYDTFDYITSSHQRHELSAIFFFLLADFGPMDKNVPHTSEALRHLISHQIPASSAALHPSVASNGNDDTLRMELERLNDLTGLRCHRSRQHYLMLRFPETYRALITAGIDEDYSMGYADDVGFRAGTSRPFKWFDLERNETTNLTVHPFAVMDATLQRYLKLSPDEAIQLNHQLMEEVKNVGGTFISLWHNETLTDQREWSGWRRVWEQLLKEATS